MSFDGKTAIITGGASGIGHSCAEGFAEESTNVVIADINPNGEDITAHMSADADGSELIVLSPGVNKFGGIG